MTVSYQCHKFRSVTIKQNAKVCPLQKYFSNFSGFERSQLHQENGTQSQKQRRKDTPPEKKDTRVYNSSCTPPSVKKQSLLTKYYAERFLDHKEA